MRKNELSLISIVCISNQYKDWLQKNSETVILNFFKKIEKNSDVYNSLYILSKELKTKRTNDKHMYSEMTNLDFSII